MDGTLWTIHKLIVVNINVAARRLGIRQHIYGRQFFHSTLLQGGLARKRKSIINFKDCLVMITINSILISTTDTRSSAQAQQQGAEEKFHYKNWQTENLIFTQRPFSDRLMPHHEKCRQRRVSKVMKRKKFISEKFSVLLLTLFSTLMSTTSSVVWCVCQRFTWDDSVRRLLGSRHCAPSPLWSHSLVK